MTKRSHRSKFNHFKSIASKSIKGALCHSMVELHGLWMAVRDRYCVECIPEARIVYIYIYIFMYCYSKHARANVARRVRDNRRVWSTIRDAERQWQRFILLFLSHIVRGSKCLRAGLRTVYIWLCELYIYIY